MTDFVQFRKDYQFILAFTLLIWVIKSAETLFHFSLHSWGVRPGELSGLVGIVTAPLIHGSWQHVAANTLPMLVLGAVLVYGYPKTRWRTFFIVWFVSGLGVWMFGRDSYHFGASGVAYGLFYCVFTMAILRRDKRSIALMLVASFMFGSMILGILPWDPKISFEAHLFGGLGGLLSAVLFQNIDPKPTEKKYEWEEDGYIEDDEEPYWLERSAREDSVSDSEFKRHYH